MKTPLKLTIYLIALLVGFGAAFGVGRLAVPSELADNWAATATHEPTVPAPVRGLSLSADGYELTALTAPAAVGDNGELTFQIRTADGEPVRRFATEHGRELHAIVVRSDGTQYRHVHPILDEASGTWAMPWAWVEAGTYRVLADFTSEGGSQAVTLSRTIQVGGAFTPVAPEPNQTADVAGFTLTLDGDLTPGATSALTIDVQRDGEPVTTLEPYLGAFGHLVVLRDGDLAYVHVHADGDPSQPGGTAGPNLAFGAEAPTTGRYLLYLDFMVDGQVHTAEFVLDAGPAEAATAHGEEPHDDEH